MKSNKYIDQVKDFFYNKRHIEAIVLAVIIVIIISVVAANSGQGGSGQNKATASGNASSTKTAVTESTAGTSDDSSESTDDTSGYKKEEKGSDLHDLLTEYYKDYAAGDTDDIEKVASPVSDMEKSYIRFMAKILDSYDIKEIYTKNGATEGSKLVSVYVQMHFKGLKSAAPGLDFFYVEKDSSGNLHINNLYSSFNQTNRENDMDPTVVSAIASFEEQKDVVDLQTKVQKEYNEISLSDKDFDEFMSKTYPAKVKSWQSEYRKKAKAAEKKQKAEEKKKKEAEEKKEKAKKSSTKKKSSSKKPKEGKKLVLKDTVNIRKKPSTSSKRINLAYEGEKVLVLKNRKDGWTKVQFHHKKGYVKTEFLK